MCPHQFIFCLFRKGKLPIPLARSVSLFLPGHSIRLHSSFILTLLSALLQTLLTCQMLSHLHGMCTGSIKGLSMTRAPDMYSSNDNS